MTIQTRTPPHYSNRLTVLQLCKSISFIAITIEIESIIYFHRLIYKFVLFNFPILTFTAIAFLFIPVQWHFDVANKCLLIHNQMHAAIMFTWDHCCIYYLYMLLFLRIILNKMQNIEWLCLWHRISYHDSVCVGFVWVVA